MGGIQYIFRGMAMLLQPGVRPFVAIPLLINLTLFGVGFWYGWQKLQEFVIWVESFTPSWLQWLEWILGPVFFLLGLFIMFFTFTILANIISAPFNGLLAEKVELVALGKPFPEDSDDFGRILAGFGPAIWNELNKTVYVLGWSIPLSILFIIPFTLPFAPLASIIFASWMMAVEYVDIPMGNHDFTGKEIRRRLRSKRFTSLGFGFGVTAMTMIPVLNFLAVPTAVAAATLFWVEKLSVTGKTPQI